jgi:hypothetical protein
LKHLQDNWRSPFVSRMARVKSLIIGSILGSSGRGGRRNIFLLWAAIKMSLVVIRVKRLRWLRHCSLLGIITRLSSLGELCFRRKKLLELRWRSPFVVSHVIEGARGSLGDVRLIVGWSILRLRVVAIGLVT